MRDPLYVIHLGELDGLKAKLLADPDDDHDPFDGDWLGTMSDDRVDGSSVKIQMRNHSRWWTPPPDAVRGPDADPARVAALRKLVVGYFSERLTICRLTLSVEFMGFNGTASIGGVWTADTTSETEAEFISYAPDLYDDALDSLYRSINSAIERGDKARAAMPRMIDIRNKIKE